MPTVLTQKYAPKTLDQIILSPENQKFFSDGFDLKESTNLLCIGNSGTGKTTLAKILAKGYDYIYINASDENGIDTIRSKVMDFIKTSSLFGEMKVVILDEADGLSSISTGNGSSAQQALRNVMEENLDHARFILTANYEHKIIEPLASRCKTLYFSLTKKDIAKTLVRILNAEKVTFEKRDLIEHVNAYFPDLRKAINELNIQDGKFVFKKVVSDAIPTKIKTLIAKGVNVFDIRAAIIKEEDSFQGDYLSIMRGLYDLYCADKNMGAVMAVCLHMEKHVHVMDKEVNFTSLLLNLSKL